ncbi:hypothetical protein GCM10010160_62940 [Acrocarpospora corrugata]
MHRPRTIGFPLHEPDLHTRESQKLRRHHIPLHAPVRLVIVCLDNKDHLRRRARFRSLPPCRAITERNQRQLPNALNRLPNPLICEEPHWLPSS